MRVGVREGQAEDKTRGNWDGDGPRPLTWAAWYPAADDSVEQAQLMGRADAPWFLLGSAAPMRPWPGGRDPTRSSCCRMAPALQACNGRAGDWPSWHSSRSR